MTPATRHLVLVLGDQLDERSSAFDGFEASADAVWMAEVDEESTHVWSHKARIALFLAAMRHFRDTLRRRGLRVEYRQLDDSENRHSLAAELVAAIERLCPRKLILVEPGDWRVREGLRETARAAGVELEVRPDRHFLCPSEQFAEHAQGRKQLRLEPFYRAMRRQLNVLMDGDQPAGGTWNYDKENRGSFGKQVPAPIPVPCGFTPDATTGAVLALVDARFKSHPGGLASFDWPVTPQQARAALDRANAS